MKNNFDGAVQKPDAETVAEALFEGTSTKTDTAMQFSPELAFLFNGNSDARAQGLAAVNLIIAGIDPDVAIGHAYETLRATVVQRLMN